jgi:curved DNA-binding protein CbpA
MRTRTLYEALDLPPEADEGQIKAAYRALARRLHPDVNGGNAAGAERLAKVNQAYATLGHPEMRAAYDRDLAQRRAELRRRYVFFAASSVATFVLTASVVSFAVRRHLEAGAAAAKEPAAALAQSPTSGPQPTQQWRSDIAPPSPGAVPANWTTYRNARFDFVLRYPAGVFRLDAGRSGAHVQTFVSRDGRATLRILAAENSAGLSLGRVRSALIRERYAGASFDQTPQRRHWFALAGTRGQEVFMERVTFSCDGRSMHGWQMTYPANQRETYDELAKLVLRNDPHGNGPGAGCDDAKPKRAKQTQRRG